MSNQENPRNRKLSREARERAAVLGISHQQAVEGFKEAQALADKKLDPGSLAWLEPALASHAALRAHLGAMHLFELDSMTKKGIGALARLHAWDHETGVQGPEHDHPGLGLRPRMQQNTELTYIYRDAANYKVQRTLTLAGEFTSAQLDEIEALLDEGDGFIPSQVGLDDLQEELAGFGNGELDDDDHVWHEWPARSELHLVDRPADGPSCAELHAAFRALGERGGWDLGAALELHGIEIGAPVMTETEEESGICSGCGNPPYWTEEGWKGHDEDCDRLGEGPDMAAPAADPVIPAETHSDDYQFQIEFDALAWFEQASDNELTALAECGFGGDYPADAVAEFFEDRPEGQEIAAMLDYSRASVRGISETVGFECHVDQAAAERWIKAHRPEIAAKLEP